MVTARKKGPSLVLNETPNVQGPLQAHISEKVLVQQRACSCATGHSCASYPAIESDTERDA